MATCYICMADAPKRRGTRYCVECKPKIKAEHIRKNKKLDYEKHKDAYKARAKRSAAKPENKEKKRIYSRIYGRKLTREKRHENQQRYRSKDVESYRTMKLLSQQKREAIKANAPGSGITKEQWYGVLESFGNRCAYCLRSEVKLTIDHFVPISKGGEHDIKNIVPACLSCNSSKNNSLFIYWAYHFNDRLKVA